MRRILLELPCLAVLLVAASRPLAPPVPPRVHLVGMVEKGQYGLAFDPARLTARLGDTVRFVQRGSLPHNLRLRSWPADVDLGEGLESPMLTEPGATFDLVLDARFRPGKYFFICVPHEVMGMAGILYVEPESP